MKKIYLILDTNSVLGFGSFVYNKISFNPELYAKEGILVTLKKKE
jgi:hypothetical protein